MDAPTFTPPRDVVDVLAGECLAIAMAMAPVAEADYVRATRCAEWDVKALLAHVWRDVDRVLEYTRQPSPDAADSDAVAYFLTGYDPLADAPDVAARAIEVAGRFATGAELLADFDERWRAAVDVARATPPDRLIRTFGPSLRFDEYLCTRTLEAAVHGLDLADALGLRPWITPAADDLVVAMLVAMLGDDVRERLGWDDVTFIDAATGRRRIDDAERSALGGLADRVPVVS
jgi:uncharacterized protein (TIGR03083 family)